MSDWFIYEEGNPEDGYTWNLLKRETGTRATLMAQFFDEHCAEELLEAAKWREALQSGLLSLNLGDCPIDANTGLP